jgi:ribonucleotide reductase beta subunit family protein with ferritin-like domain
MMSEYIEFSADRLIYALGYKKKYHTKNPFDWMELISLQSKTNFFERRVSEYQKAGVSISSKVTDSDVFTTKADF